MSDSSTSFASFVEGLQNEIVQPPQSQKVKLLLVSTHINQASGYAKVSFGLLKELAKIPWLTVHHYGIQAHPNLHLQRAYPPTVIVHDAAALEVNKKEGGGFGYSELGPIVEQLQPHVVMLYNDIVVCTKYLSTLIPLKIQKGLNFQVWTYLDQVYEVQPSELLETLQRDTDRFFAFTHEWKDILRRQGITRPIDILQHGYDAQLVQTTAGKNLMRQRMGIPPEIVLFLNVNRNQPRKRLDLLIMAFVDLIVRHPTKLLFLMCVCDKGDKGGFPLFEIYRRELVLKGVQPALFANRLLVSGKEMSMTDEEIAQFYTVADVGVSTADGEGFGLCAFEQMGLGIPQVLTNVVGHRDYCEKDNSLLVDTVLRTYMPVCLSGQGGDPRLVDPAVFSRAMEKYVIEEDLRYLHGENAKKKVATYTWPAVTSTLVKRLTFLKQELELE